MANHRDTTADANDYFELLGGVAYVTRLPGYKQEDRRYSVPIPRSENSEYFLDHYVQGRHGSAVILILPDGYTLDTHSPSLLNS